MAGNQISGDGLASNLAGMSKNQLYDIMCQMKSLIEQNQHQARKILIQNPLLTRALFQAQIMLGMVQVPQASNQPQAAPQPSPPVQQTNIHAAHSAPKQVSLPDQANISQAQVPVRKQQHNQPSLPITSTPMQGMHSQSIPPQVVEQHRGPLNTHASQMPHPQSSQVPNMPPLSMHSGSQPPPVHQPPMPPVPGHLQQPMQTTGVSHHQLQPPLPPQPRPPIQMQYQSQIGTNVNFQNAGIPQMHHSQPMYHTSSRPPTGTGPFTQGQPPPLPHQPPHQSLYQSGGSHMNVDFNHQSGNKMQMERPSSWPPVSRENTSGAQLPAPSLGPGPQPVGNQPHRPPPLTPEVEQQLLQQVMSLTPEQINLLPPEQRHQVLQLQQMLRQ
ncbi:cleavage stimulating factor 64-like isoform X2 [Chenopodium quinoa]|uniref:cleavage stimulating factor 64-like isoform X2 n=1 Tax=Chenopodium quinoa TaxID=63459 RepID=UPI000B78CB05|nr:cleavage stimulating factor 64-like isoform X2 [Chenopodium quinoa]